MSDEELLDQAFDALRSFTNDMRWSTTWQGHIVSALAKRLGVEDPFDNELEGRGE